MNLPANMVSKISVELCPVADLDGFCWTWTGALNSRGYGCVGVNGKSQLSHRVAYQLIVGPIESGLQIDHLCRNKRCCNPAHLEPVTGRVNSSRTDRANKTHCVRGHAYTEENTGCKVRGKNGELRHRYCRQCQIENLRAYRQRRSAKAAS